ARGPAVLPRRRDRGDAGGAQALGPGVEVLPLPLAVVVAAAGATHGQGRALLHPRVGRVGAGGELGMPEVAVGHAAGAAAPIEVGDGAAEADEIGRAHV